MAHILDSGDVYVSSWSKIETNTEYFTPIEHLFKAIYILQNVVECQEECELLCTKLHEAFMQIPEQEGVRVFANSLTYYPTGLCSWAGLRSPVAVLLPTWETEYVPPEPVRATPEEPKPSKKGKGKPRSIETHAMNALRLIYPLWWIQLKERAGKKYDVPASLPDGIRNFAKYTAQYEKYEHLPIEAKFILAEDNNVDSMLHGNGFNAYEHFRTYHPNWKNINMQYEGISDYLINRNVLFFLCEDELDEFFAAAQCGAQTWGGSGGRYYHRGLGYYVQQEIKRFIKSLDMKREDRIMFSLNGCVSKAETVKRYSQHVWLNEEKTKGELRMVNSAVVELTWKTMFKVLPEQMSQVQDKTIRKVLVKAGFMTEDGFVDLEPEEAEQELEAEAV